MLSRQRIARRAVSMAVAGAAAAGVAATAGAADRPLAAGGLDRFHEQRLDWKGCALGPDDEVGRGLDEAGARCADVTVPLDYARPAGRTVEIAISRLPASDPEHRIGTMVLNGGGPGPALDLPPYLREVMGEAGRRFDLVGMDPRSLGRSAPVDCGWPASTWIRSAGESRDSFRRSAAFARDLAERCARTNRDLIPHVSTRDIARDMDVVRAALGERKISYNGASYGTYLGAVYAAMFPGRLDRTVLDSAVDPRTWGPGLLRGTEAANERALADWAAWAARRDADFGLGATRAEVLAAVRGIVRASSREPLEVGRYRLDDTVVPVVLFNYLDDDSDPARTVLAETVRVLRAAADGGHAEPTPDLEEGLGFLLTGAQSEYGSGQSAVICGDGPAVRGTRPYWRDVQEHRAAAPIFGPLAYGVDPCAFWPVRPAEPPARIGGELPALIVAATGDTRTVYAGGKFLRRVLRGSRMITLDANVHAPHQRGYGNDCVDDRVGEYLLTGRLPRDAWCAPEDGRAS